MGELDREDEYIEEEIDDGDGSEIEVINEDDEDSSHRQFSVVVALAVEDIDEWIDTKLELEDEIKDDDIDCDDEEIETLDDCSELVETWEEDDDDDTMLEDDERLIWELLEDSSHEHSVLTGDLVHGPVQERELCCKVLSTEYVRLTEQS